MNGFVVVGTDTDAGKTAFSLLYLAAFPGQFAYWKPAETGDSDSEKVRSLVPGATIFEPLARFSEPVAPALAARREGLTMPGVSEILAAIPTTELPLLIETFGGPLSPLTEDVLQLELIRALALPVVLVSSTSVGAIGRTLAAVRALDGVELAAIALIGPADEFAREQLMRHLPDVPVLALTMPPGTWTPDSIREAVHAPLRGLRVAAKRYPQDSFVADREFVWHPYTPLRTEEPLHIVAAENEFLHLADGRRIIDGISSWWTILHGHRQPAIMQAIRDATRRLDHVLFAGATHPDAVERSEERRVGKECCR